MSYDEYREADEEQEGNSLRPWPDVPVSAHRLRRPAGRGVGTAPEVPAAIGPGTSGSSLHRFRSAASRRYRRPEDVERNSGHRVLLLLRLLPCDLPQRSGEACCDPPRVCTTEIGTSYALLTDQAGRVPPLTRGGGARSISSQVASWLQCTARPVPSVAVVTAEGRRHEPGLRRLPLIAVLAVSTMALSGCLISNLSGGTVGGVTTAQATVTCWTISLVVNRREHDHVYARHPVGLPGGSTQSFPLLIKLLGWTVPILSTIR